MLSHAILRCPLQFLPEHLLENNLLGLLQVLNSAALRLVRTAAAAFTPVLGGDHKLSVLLFSLASESAFALYACKAILFRFVFHIPNPPHLLLKFLCLLLVAVGGLYEAHLAILFKI